MSRPGSGPHVGAASSTVVRFGPADVGRRVTLRRRLAEPTAEGTLGDVVGVLESWRDDVLRLRRRTGEVVEVLAPTLVAGRVVAPEISAEEAATTEVEDRLGSDREDQLERLGEWVLHLVPAAPAGAAVLAVGDPGVPVAEALARVRQRCVDAGVTPAVAAVEPSVLASELAAAGWQEVARVAVLTTEPPVPDPSARRARRTPPPPRSFRVVAVPGDEGQDARSEERDGFTVHHHQVVLRAPDTPR